MELLSNRGETHHGVSSFPANAAIAYDGLPIQDAATVVHVFAAEWARRVVFEPRQQTRLRVEDVAAG